MKRLAMITALAVSVVLCLGVLSAYGQEGPPGERPPGPPRGRQRPDMQSQQFMPRVIMRMLDLNKDGQISLKEYMKFFTDLDKNEDGAASQQELMDEMSKRRQTMGGGRPPAGSGRPPEGSGRPRQGRGPQEGQIPQQGSGPNVGDDAPDFALISLDGKRTVKLSDFKGRETVVLVFGSYT